MRSSMRRSAISRMSHRDVARKAEPWLQQQRQGDAGAVQGDRMRQYSDAPCPCISAALYRMPENSIIT